MDTPTITAQDLVQLIPSAKAISEKLSPEEYAEFHDQVTALTSKLQTFEIENNSLKDTLATAQASEQKLTTTVEGLKSEKLLLEADVIALRPFKAKIEEITAKGSALPVADASFTQPHTSTATDSPDALAIAAFRAAKGL